MANSMFSIEKRLTLKGKKVPFSPHPLVKFRFLKRGRFRNRKTSCSKARSDCSTSGHRRGKLETPHGHYVQGPRETASQGQAN